MEMLVAAGCPGGQDDLQKLADWLTTQEVSKLDDLRCAGDLSRLEGSCVLLVVHYVRVGLLVTRQEHPNYLQRA